MDEYKCGDFFYADMCEESEILDGFNRDNPAYCSMFLNSDDVTQVRHGRWGRSGPLLECQCCGEVYSQLGGNAGKAWNFCPNCGADMRGSNDE